MTKSARPSLPSLDARLACIAEAVPQCRVAADIGADHGRLSCWLMASGRCERMIVSDISAVSRKKARDLLYRFDLIDRAHLSGENGLLALNETVDAIIICGMGGGIICRMLSQRIDLEGATLILSAHSQLPDLRKSILARDYHIVREQIVRSKGRFYTVISAKPGKQHLSEKEMMVGFGLVSTKSATVSEYLSWQLSVAEEWQDAKGEQYREWLKEEIKINEG